MERGSRLRHIVQESNRQGRDAWDRFAPHRDRVQALLTGCAADDASLCILGPGNVNDVRLGSLVDQFAEVHLVDLDVAAVHSGLARQGFAGHDRCTVHEPTDLTGMLDGLDAAADPEAGTRLVDGLLRQLCTVRGSPFDVTLSSGLLTQLLQSVVDSTLARDEVARVSLALRDKHLRDLVNLTRIGGTLILVTDIVSTASAPWLARVGHSDLEAEMAALVASGNFFTGTNPYRIVALLEEDSRLQSKVTDVRLLEPWLWAVTPDREHLTCAMTARRV